MIDGAKSLAMTAIDVLTDKKMMQQANDFATAEFSAQSIAQTGTAKAGMKTVMLR